MDVGSGCSRSSHKFACAVVDFAAHVFPNSQFILEENRNVLGMPIPMATVTYSAAEERFKPIEDVSVVEGFRHRYDLPREFIAVVTRAVHPGRESGPLFPGKSPEVAFRAFARVRNRIPHELVFVGRRVREHLIQAEGALPDFSRVRFIDHIPFEDMHLLYKAAAIFVDPCIYEGCPNTDCKRWHAVGLALLPQQAVAPMWVAGAHSSHALWMMKIWLANYRRWLWMKICRRSWQPQFTTITRVQLAQVGRAHWMCSKRSHNRCGNRT